MKFLELKIPPGLLFALCLALMWGINQWFPDQSLSFPGSEWVMWILLLTGLVLGLEALAVFYRRNTTINPHTPEKTTTLVTEGIYRISRNPMYLALLCILISAVFYWNNIYTLIGIPIFVFYMNRFQIQPEERMMEKYFGDEFEQYRQAVRRWV